MLLAAIAFGLLVGLAVVMWPKLGTYLFMPVLCLYPQGWWLQQQFLPLNIRADDLFGLFVFLVVVVRRNLFGGVPVRFGWGFWVVSGLAVILVAANTAGYLAPADWLAELTSLKAALKAGVVWAMFYAVLHCIDTPEDLRRQCAAFAIGTGLGALPVILQNYYPVQMEIFLAPPEPGQRVLVGEGVRGMGAFLNPNTAGCMLGAGVLMAVTAIRAAPRGLLRLVCYAAICTMLLGLLYTRSRGALIALAVPVMVMSLLSRSRYVIWTAAAGALVLALTFRGAWDMFQERFVEAYEQAAGGWDRNVAGRFQTWASYFDTATTVDYIVGQGQMAGIIKNGMESHNVFVSLITVYGIGGFLWGCATTYGFLRRLAKLKPWANEVVGKIASGCGWTLLAWSLFSMTNDTISSHFPRHVLMLLVVLLDRAYVLANERYRPVGFVSSFVPYGAVPAPGGGWRLPDRQPLTAQALAPGAGPGPAASGAGGAAGTMP